MGAEYRITMGGVQGTNGMEYQVRQLVPWSDNACSARRAEQGRVTDDVISVVSADKDRAQR